MVSLVGSRLGLANEAERGLFCQRPSCFSTPTAAVGAWRPPLRPHHPVPPSQALLAGLLSRLEPMLHTLCSEGFAPLEQEYYSAWLHSGQEVGAAPCWAQVGSCLQEASWPGLPACAHPREQGCVLAGMHLASGMVCPACPLTAAAAAAAAAAQPLPPRPCLPKCRCTWRRRGGWCRCG